MQIEKPHPDAVEKRELRSAHSKTFAMPDGKMRCEVRSGAVCYQSDEGELRSIDTKVQQAGSKTFVEWAPYKFELHKTGIGFDFQSRESGFARVSLVGLGGEKFDPSQTLKPVIEGDTITFPDVRPGCDIVFRMLPLRVKTLRVLHNADTPREFTWLCEHDADGKDKIDDSLTGDDAARHELDLSTEVIPIDEHSYHFIERWSGLVKVRDKQTRRKTLSDAVAYPVSIDPTVNASIAVGADDGQQATFWANGYTAIPLGRVYDVTHMGFRFTNITVPQGATVSSATLTLLANAVAGAGGAGKVYGWASDNAPVFDNSGNRPTQVPKTTASTTIAAIGTTGTKNITVTGIAQEYVNRAGWASGNAMNFPVLSTTVTYYNYTVFEAYEAAGTSQASLSITYTGGGAGAVIPVFMNQYRQRRA